MIDEFAKEYLHHDLQMVRETMLWKLDGLSEYNARRPLTPTGTNLLGMIKHLTITETWYFGKVFERPFPERLPWWDDRAEGADMWATADESRAEIVDRYKRVWEHSDATSVTTESSLPSSPDNSSEMTLDDVLAFLDLMDENGIDVVVDGGWGVDALLGWQSRTHRDLDIGVQHRHVPRLRQVLQDRGYTDVERKDTQTYNFVLGDSKGHLIDIHSFEFDDQGNLLGGIAYPFDALTGTGTINGRLVRCITPARMVEFHAAYEGDEDDYKDVLALCPKFELPLPDYYAHWPNA